MRPRPPIYPLFPYTTLFRSAGGHVAAPDLGAVHVHDGAIVALDPQCRRGDQRRVGNSERLAEIRRDELRRRARAERSEEHTSELQSQSNLVCRLPLEKKKRE